MDEGHIATTEDFVKYKNRLDDIFYTEDHIMVGSEKKINSYNIFY